MMAARVSRRTSRLALFLSILLVVIQTTVADFIVESRLWGKNFDCYSDVACADSSAKSRANGCTPGLGSRYSTSSAAQATFQFTPFWSCYHDVYATWGNSDSGDTCVQFTITHEDGSTTVTKNQKRGAGGEDIWNLLGSFRFVIGKTYTVTITNETSEGSTSSPRLMSDAVRWAPCVGYCLANLDPPPIRTPLVAGDTAVTVLGVPAEATRVRVWANEFPVGENLSPDGSSEVIVSVPALENGQHICATYALSNGCESCPRPDTAPVVGDCAQVPPVDISGVLLAGDTAVRVSGVSPDASSVQVYADGVPIGTNLDPGGGSTVEVQVTALVNGQAVAATQSIRGLQGCMPQQPRYVDDPDQVPPLSVVGILDAGRTVVRVNEVTPETTAVKIYASDDCLGDRLIANLPVSGASGTVKVTVPPLVVDDRIWAAQTIRIDGPVPSVKRRVMARNVIEDFEDPIKTADTPFPQGQYRTWYQVANNAWSQVPITDLFGSRCMEFRDDGYTNGVYAVYDQIVPAEAYYFLEVDMLINEPDSSDLAFINQFEVGVVVRGEHRDPAAMLPAVISPINSYQGLTTGQDGQGASAAQRVRVGNFLAQEGDDLLIVFSTDTATYIRSGAAVPSSPLPGMKIDNIRLIKASAGLTCEDIPPIDILPTETCPLVAGGNCLYLRGMDPYAEKLRVYANGNLMFEWTPGQPPPPLNLTQGTWLAATQEIFGVEGCMPTEGPMVGEWWSSPIRVALSIRETGQTSGEIGSDGGISGTIEWVGAAGKMGEAPVGKLLDMRYGWQTVTFNCRGANADFVTPFTGDGVVDGNYGVLEGLGFKIEDPYLTGPYTVHIDSIANGATLLSDFDMIPEIPGTPVMFRKPGFSNTTYAHLLAYPDVAELDPSRGADGSGQSYKLQFQFYNDWPCRWMHLTTRGDAASPPMLLQNPLIDLNQPITIKFKLVGAFHPEPVMDVDYDGDLDAVDFAALQRCLTIGTNAYGGWIEPEPACYMHDYDFNARIDGGDIAEFLECARGPGLGPGPLPGCNY